MSSAIVGTGILTASGASNIQSIALATASGGPSASVTSLLGATSTMLSSLAAAQSSAPASHSSSQGMTDAEESWQAAQSTRFTHWTFVSLAAVCSVLFLYRMFVIAGAHIRHIVCISDNQQKYWARPLSPFWAKFKKNFVYAPLLGRRHNREFRLSAATNVGTLPSRFQMLFLTGLLAMNVTLCVFNIQWSQNKFIVLSQIRNRTGILSVINMVPLFLLAGRNNPLIVWLRISFDTYNLMHRWLGRIVILEAVAHSAAHMTNTILSKGMGAFTKSLYGSELIMVGFISTIALVVILIQSPSIVRHAFYETFLGIHLALAIVAVVTLYYHLAIIEVEWLLYLQIAIGFWVAERLCRFVNILYRNFGRRMTTATITAMSTDACRVTLDMPRPWKFKPGQHIFLYLPGLTLWQSHPFSVAWSDESSQLSWNEKEELPSNRQDIYGPKKVTMELIVRRRTGATDTLFRKADMALNKTITLKAVVEGPYGGVHSLSSYGTVVMFAGGIGITHHLPYVRELVQGYADGTVATRKVTLVWVLQHPEHLQWVKAQMTQILAMERRREVLKVILFITRPKQSKEILSPSSTVQMFPGKPRVDQLLETEVANRVGAMAVSVCGPGSLSDDCRKSARAHIDAGNLDFIEEAFSW